MIKIWVPGVRNTDAINDQIGQINDADNIVTKYRGLKTKRQQRKTIVTDARSVIGVKQSFNLRKSNLIAPSKHRNFASRHRHQKILLLQRRKIVLR